MNTSASVRRRTPRTGFLPPHTDLSVLDLGGESRDVFAEFDVLALGFVQEDGHRLQLDLQEDNRTHSWSQNRTHGRGVRTGQTLTASDSSRVRIVQHLINKIK